MVYIGGQLSAFKLGFEEVGEDSSYELATNTDTPPGPVYPFPADLW